MVNSSLMVINSQSLIIDLWLLNPNSWWLNISFWCYIPNCWWFRTQIFDGWIPHVLSIFDGLCNPNFWCFKTQVLMVIHPSCWWWNPSFSSFKASFCWSTSHFSHRDRSLSDAERRRCVLLRSASAVIGQSHVVGWSSNILSIWYYYITVIITTSTIIS